MRFELLSRNTMILMDEIIKNKRLVKLIDSKTFDGKTVNGGALIMNKIIPAPYTGVVPQNQETNLRVFFPSGKLKNRVVLDVDLVFQIVLHKDLWTMFDEDNKTRIIRPYVMMEEIRKIFEDKSISTLGVIHFDGFIYQYLDKDYHLFNFKAVMTAL